MRPSHHGWQNQQCAGMYPSHDLLSMIVQVQMRDVHECSSSEIWLHTVCFVAGKACVSRSIGHVLLTCAEELGRRGGIHFSTILCTIGLRYPFCNTAKRKGCILLFAIVLLRTWLFLPCGDAWCACSSLCNITVNSLVNMQQHSLLALLCFPSPSAYAVCRMLCKNTFESRIDAILKKKA